MSWRTREAVALVPSEVPRITRTSFSLKTGTLKTKKLPVFQVEPKAGKKLMFQFKTIRQGQFLLIMEEPAFLVLILSTDWGRPTHIREGNLLYSVY
jgi:hypothetical protein